MKSYINHSPQLLSDSVTHGLSTDAVIPFVSCQYICIKFNNDDDRPNNQACSQDFTWGHRSCEGALFSSLLTSDRENSVTLLNKAGPTS